MEWPRAEDLLAGPRAWRLRWSLLEPGDHPRWDLVWDAAHGGNLTGLTAELTACVALTKLDSTVAHADHGAAQVAEMFFQFVGTGTSGSPFRLNRFLQLVGAGTSAD